MLAFEQLADVTVRHVLAPSDGRGGDISKSQISFDVGLDRA